AVRSDQTRTVDRKAHRQVLDRHVVHDLVVGALQKGRIDRAERAHPLRGQARGESDRVLLGNTDIEAPLWEFGGELVEAGAARHRGGNGADRAVTLRFREQSLGKDAGVARRPGGALGLLAGDDVELLHAVVLVGAVLGRRVAFALLSYDMDQARPLSRIADVFENRHKLFEVV